MTGLIGEATETKAAIEDATESMQNVAASNVYHHEQAHEQKETALEKTETFESNLFGFDNGPSGSMPPPSQSFDSRSIPDQQVPMSNSVDISLLNLPPSSPQAHFPEIPMVSTVSTDGEMMNEGQAVDPNAPIMFENELGSPALDARGPSPMPFPAQEQSRGPSPMPPPAQQQQQAPPPQQPQPVEMPTPQPLPQYQQALPPGGQPQSMGIPTPNPGQQYHQMPPQGAHPHALPTPQPPQQYMQQSNSPIPTPQYGLARPKAVADHSRKESVGGFGSDFVMGGSALPPEGGGVYGAAAAATAEVSGSGHNPADLARVEELRSKARAAQETANDAAAAHIRLAQEADELRGDADKAEAGARTLRAAADEKKKGRFGAGKKKSLNVSEKNRNFDMFEGIKMISRIALFCNREMPIPPPTLPMIFESDSWPSRPKLMMLRL